MWPLKNVFLILYLSFHWHACSVFMAPGSWFPLEPTHFGTFYFRIPSESVSVCPSLPEFPFPEGEPLAAAQEATSVTLTCTESVSVPPANTTWRRGLQQELIVPGSKYVLSEEGPTLRLTILNITKDDEGVYFCRSENPLAVRELEVYLTVRSESGRKEGVRDSSRCWRWPDQKCKQRAFVVLMNEPDGASACAGVASGMLIDLPLRPVSAS